MTPAAIIPMHHPEEAIAELEFATRQWAQGRHVRQRHAAPSAGGGERR